MGIHCIETQYLVVELVLDPVVGENMLSVYVLHAAVLVAEEWTLEEKDLVFQLATKVFLLNFPMYVAYKHIVQSPLEELSQQDAAALNNFCELTVSAVFSSAGKKGRILGSMFGISTGQRNSIKNNCHLTFSKAVKIEKSTIKSCHVVENMTKTFLDILGKFYRVLNKSHFVSQLFMVSCFLSSVTNDFQSEYLFYFAEIPKIALPKVWSNLSLLISCDVWV